MSSSLHLFSNTITGYGPPDGCLPSCRVSGGAVSISPSTSRGDHKVISDFKFLSLTCASRSRPPACNASSGRYNRNPDFPKQNKTGPSFNRSWYNGDSKNHEVSDIVSSRNGPVGPLHSDSRNPKFQETSAPGTMEHEILELFRNVQAKIREKSRGKEEKRIEVPNAKSKEEESVDSILKLLRKHTIQKMKKKSNDDSSRDSALNVQENGAVSANRRTRPFNSNDSVKHEMQESQRRHVSRPPSNFSKRSPVSRVKFQPVHSDEDSKSKEMVSNTEADLEPTFSVGDDGLDEMSVEENSDIFASDSDEDEDEDEEQDEENPITANLSEMKLSELRAIAKSRGMKRYSKMKKQDLIELLSRSSV